MAKSAGACGILKHPWPWKRDRSGDGACKMEGADRLLLERIEGAHGGRDDHALQ